MRRRLAIWASRNPEPPVNSTFSVKQATTFSIQIVNSTCIKRLFPTFFGKTFQAIKPNDNREVECLDKKCPVCKQKFMTFDAKQKYCSDACAKKANKK